MATDSRNDIINIGPVVTVDLTANAPLPGQHRLARRTSAGVMVELLVTSRDGAMLRPADDGDIAGDAVSDHSSAPTQYVTVAADGWVIWSVETYVALESPSHAAAR